MNNNGDKISWLPRATAALAVVSCYGTSVLIGLLSLMGVSLALNNRIWAGAISVFALLATLALALSYRRHRVIGPITIAVLSLGLILWVMYGVYNPIVESAGFALLIVASLWDWRAGSRCRSRARAESVHSGVQH